MSASRQFLIKLAVIVIVWYLGLSYLPGIVGTCLDGVCSFSIGEVVISLAVPLAFFAVPVALEMALYHKTLAKALSDIGLTRFNRTGIRLAAVFLLPLIVFYPLFALITNTPLSVQPAWFWLILSILLNNSLAEETMMRGFVFRHLREGRPFWTAAALSTLYFAGYHLPLLLSAGVMIGIFAVVLAVPTGFVTAYIYERGSNTIAGTALLHGVYNGLAVVVVLPANVQLVATSLYLVVAIGMSILFLVWAYRGHHERAEVTTLPPLAADSL
jgi:membrane protease YdiL (CAAX protease family)